jgi:hypothetical protein
MTRNQLTEIVQTMLGYSTVDKPTNSQDVFFVADQIRGQLIGEYINGSARSKANGHTVIPQFCLPLLLPIQTDTARNRKYVDLGTQVLGLPYNQGVFQVGLPQDEDAAFILSQAGMSPVTSNLEVGLGMGIPKCWIEGTRIYLMYSDAAWTNLLVKAVPSLFATKPDGTDLIGEDEQIPQPYEFSRFLMEHAQAAFMVQKATMQDKVIDQTTIPVG